MHKPRILILEDDPDLRDSLLESLRDHRFEAEAADSTVEALRLAGQLEFDLIVTDVRLPQGPDGIDCLAELRRLRPKMRSIVITGYASEEAPGRAIHAQASDYLHKPFTLQQLMTAIRRVLEDEQESTQLGRLVGNLTSTFQRWKQWAAEVLSPGEVARLAGDRTQAFQGLYVAIRSGWLARTEALAVYHRLEQLELEREALGEGALDPQKREELQAGYRYLTDLMTALARGAAQAPAQKGQDSVPAPIFFELYRRLKEGELSLEQLKLAPSLRAVEPQDAAADVRELRQAIWGENVPASVRPAPAPPPAAPPPTSPAAPPPRPETRPPRLPPPPSLSVWNEPPLGQSLMVFYRGLATLIASGVPITRSLQLLAYQCEHRGLRSALVACLKAMDGGQRLSQAMSSQKRCFSGLQVALINVGEQTGGLPVAIERMARHYEKSNATRAQVQSSLFYPLLISLACVVLVVLIPAYSFQSLFSFLEGLHVELPWPTRLLLGVLGLVRSPVFVVACLAALGAAWFLHQQLRRSLASRRAWENLLARVPGLGSALRAAGVAEVARSLATMYAAGVPMLKALELSAASSPSLALQEALSQAAEEARAGAPLHRSLGVTGQFPPTLIHLVAAGEEVGNVSGMLERAASLAEEEVETALQLAVGALQPLVLALVGFLVGFMILAVMTPLIQVAQSL